jgi:outer membrane receptor protein involved in Fe transport
MELLPVEDVGSIVSMQAGVVNGHFRGGRTTEVSYLIDGMQVDESFGGEGKTVEIETEAISDLEVITGTFNAEYGRAMSGIVNAVTKTGSNEYHGSFSGAMGNYYTANDDIFLGLEAKDIDRNKDFKINLSGPIIKDHLHFFLNYRFRNNKNYLNGIRRFRVTDYSDYYSSDNPEFWYTEQTGDSAYVSMDKDIMQSFMGKVSTRLFEKFNLSLLYTMNEDEWHSYDHAFKYNPDGMAASHRNSNMLAFTLNQSVSQRLFYEFKYSRIENNFGYYVYKNPQDSGYVHDVYLSDAGPGFFTGGQQKGHTLRDLLQDNLKFDLTWQITKNHKIKAGLIYIQHDLDNKERTIRNLYADKPEESEFNWIVLDDGTMKIDYPNYVPVTMSDSTVYSDIYRVKPMEFATYMQDEISYGDLVMNIGLRYETFDPATKYPTQLRNPDNSSFFPLVDEAGNVMKDEEGNEIPDPERMSSYKNADVKSQISPRLGLSYTLAKTAVLHFSYGHFFNNPPMYAMYQNHSFLIPPSDYGTVLGNPNLKAEKTVQYEVGLWQQLNDYMDIDVALFYRDIYDLLSTKIVSTYNQVEYGLYTNKDYGNVRGLEIKYNMFWHKVSAIMNYTLQYTRGVADNPTQTYTRAGDSMDPIPKLIPMNWDQRHTFNISLGYSDKNFGGTLTGYYNSGTPYTWAPISENVLSRVNLYSNNAWQPSGISVDFNGYYSIKLKDNLSLRFTLAIYNLFDRLNENWVNAATGRAYTAIVRENDLNNHRSNFNEYKDTYQNPAMYSAPRQIKIGMGITF